MTTGRIEMGPSGRTVAENIRRVREARGLSLRALSIELKNRTGRTLSADALNKIENGRDSHSDHAEAARQIRRVDIDDLVALAVALRVSPLTLLLPWPASATVEVEITAVGVTPAREAWDWALGRRPPVLSEDDPAGDLARFPLDSLPPWARPTLLPGVSARLTPEQSERLRGGGYAVLEDEEGESDGD